MSISPQDGWQPYRPSVPTAANPDQPYGQPFDPSVTSPRQQPPPPGWRQGTWTQHTVPPAKGGSGRASLLTVAALLLAIAVVIALVL